MRTKIGAMGLRVALRVNHRIIREVLATIDLEEGSFTTDEHIFRSFVVAGIPLDYPTAAIAATFSVRLFPYRTPTFANFLAYGISIPEVHQRCSGHS